ncbi:MAG: molybdenum ABC transporter ATP-binding protein [Candidatus Binatia bacterium]
MHLKCHTSLEEFFLDIDVAFESQVASIFGPSGSGKTSLLDFIAGLRDVLSGEIEIGGRVLFSTSQRINLAPQERSVGYVPQETALFPHLSVRRNILFGAGREKGPRTIAGGNLDHVAAVLEIDHLLDRGVTRLSGGECQRVALARAILSRPQLLLLDEPLASLDIGLKERIIPYLRRVRDEFTIPMIYVTHNPTEVLSLADWVLIIKKGQVVAQGVPRDVLMSGSVLSQLDRDQLENVFNVSLVDSDFKGGRSRVRFRSGQDLYIPYLLGPVDCSIQIGIRGDDILVATKYPEEISAGNVLRGIIRRIERIEGQCVMRVEAGEIFCVRLTSSAVERLKLREGGEVFLVIKARSCMIL